MDDLRRTYPDAARHLDQGADITTTYRIEQIANTTYLRVKQVSEFEGGEALFRVTGQTVVPVHADTVARTSGPLPHIMTPMAGGGTCGPSSVAEHQTIARLIVEQVDRFSTADGPDQGNLACVWAVRHLVHDALGRWITRVDGTADFDPELKACLGASHQLDVVPAGGLIISPTEDTADGRNVGHVGLLGPPAATEAARLVYSNSSAQAVWKQNFTVAKWRQRYVERKHLQMHFYPLPLRSTGPHS